MKFSILIIAILFSIACIAQDPNHQSKVMPYYAKDTTQKKVSVDSLAIPIFSTKDVMGYLTRINNKSLAIKELDLSKTEAYDQLVKELNKIIGEMDKKRKGIK